MTEQELTTAGLINSNPDDLAGLGEWKSNGIVPNESTIRTEMYLAEKFGKNATLLGVSYPVDETTQLPVETFTTSNIEVRCWYLDSNGDPKPTKDLRVHRNAIFNCGFAMMQSNGLPVVFALTNINNDSAIFKADGGWVVKCKVTGDSIDYAFSTII